jgi:hypothetical protein
VVQSWREITSGGTRTRKAEYHWSIELDVCAVWKFTFLISVRNSIFCFVSKAFCNRVTKQRSSHTCKLFVFGFGLHPVSLWNIIPWTRVLQFVQRFCSFLRSPHTPAPLVPGVPTGTAPPYSFAFHLSEACWDLLLTPSAPTLWSADKSPVVQPPFTPCTASSAIRSHGNQSFSFTSQIFVSPNCCSTPKVETLHTSRGDGRVEITT